MVHFFFLPLLGYGGPLDHEERPDEVILAAQARTEEAERPRSQFEQQLEYADNAEDEQKVRGIAKLCIKFLIIRLSSVS